MALVVESLLGHGLKLAVHQKYSLTMRQLVALESCAFDLQENLARHARQLEWAASDSGLIRMQFNKKQEVHTKLLLNLWALTERTVQ